MKCFECIAFVVANICNMAVDDCLGLGQHRSFAGQWQERISACWSRKVKALSGVAVSGVRVWCSK